MRSRHAAVTASQVVSPASIFWAISLAGRLTNHSQASEDDLTLLADALRKVGQRTTSSNLRNWCLTRALTLEGRIDGARLNNHRFSRRQIEGWSVETAVSVLRVLIDPATLTGIDIHLTVELDGERTTSRALLTAKAATPS